MISSRFREPTQLLGLPGHPAKHPAPSTEADLAMKATTHLALLVLLAMTDPGVVARAQAPNPGSANYKTQVAPILAKYCVSCHGPTKAKGGLNLALFPDDASVARDLKTWQKVLDNVEGGQMPPDDQPQPTAGESAQVAHYLQSVLSKTNCSIAQDPGRVTLRRLNREEYNNTIRDLVGVDFRPADDFPSDDVGYGFDNIGDVLTLPPLLMEKYLAAAEAIANEAILADDTPRGPSRRWRAEAVAKPKSSTLR